MIDRATVERILDATEIVDVVSEFVTLRKRGVNYVGLCPFHDDKTPSFYVSPTKGVCKCFACGKGGNAVHFLMEHEQITYPEALRWLARKYNIEIKERELSDEEKREAGERESMFIVNEWALEYFQGVMANDPDGRAIGKQYFRSRGFRDDIISKFQLGYALPRRDALSTAAKAKGYKEEFLVKTGLCYRKDSGELVDRYAGRVIFPWINVSGKVVAFGGRLLDSRTKGVQQKYVNSSDSEIYHKDHELYGIYQAKKSIVKEDRVFMVEGYTDVISMHQCGIENVVANSGTALSLHQIRLLRRFTPNIVLLYDGDEAGIHAAMRGTDMLLSEGMNIKVLILPDGDDPDSFSRKHTAEEFRAYIDDHQTDFIEFKTKLMLNGVTDPVKRSEAISSIVKSVSVIPDQITRDTYLHECSVRLQMSERTLIATMNRFISGEREEKAKEAEREERRMARDAAEATTGNAPNRTAYRRRTDTAGGKDDNTRGAPPRRRDNIRRARNRRRADRQPVCRAIHRLRSRARRAQIHRRTLQPHTRRSRGTQHGRRVQGRELLPPPPRHRHKRTGRTARAEPLQAEPEPRNEAYGRQPAPARDPPGARPKDEHCKETPQKTYRHRCARRAPTWTA